ncbi:hypothetical protein FK216_15590 [Moraxellaceae bacterium AER2_44_116]|nr:hypothetical protein FK216_15590 [Moraxellaceae bacterium AER2_44_116]
MTKQEAYELLSCNGSELAEKLGITPAAVYQWDDDEIPVGRVYQIKDLANGKEPLQVKKQAA